MMKSMKFKNTDNCGNPKQNYLDKLAAMTDADLHAETRQKIWLSAYANNNPRSDYHWQCDATYDEWNCRGNLDGYKKAYDEEYAANFG